MVKLEVPHFSTAAPQGATRRTFQPPFTPKLFRKCLLGQSTGLPMVHQALCHSVTIRERIEAKEPDHTRHVVDTRKCSVVLLPVDDRHRVAADDFRHIPLP